MKSSEIKYATIFVSVIFVVLTVFIISTNNKSKYISEKEKELSNYSYKVEKCYEKGLLPVKYTLDKEQYKEIAQIPLPAQAELLLSYNITSKRVKFKAFQNIEPIELA